MTNWAWPAQADALKAEDQELAGKLTETQFAGSSSK